MSFQANLFSLYMHGGSGVAVDHLRCNKELQKSKFSLVISLIGPTAWLRETLDKRLGMKSPSLGLGKKQIRQWLVFNTMCKESNVKRL